MIRSIRTLSRLCLPLLLAGCAQNSIFELTMNIEPPPEVASTGDLRDKVLIEARTGDADFEADWQQTQITGIVLDPGTSNTVLASFEGSGEVLEQQLRVKIRFCVDPRCTQPLPDGNAPELRYEFQRVFYQGRYTSYELDIPTIPASGSTPARMIGKCDIVGEGCWEGATDNNCLGDGRHFCEDT